MGDKSMLRRVLREFEEEVIDEVQAQVNQAHDMLTSQSTITQAVYNKGRTDGMAELWRFLQELSELDEHPEG